ncbi:MAG: cytochrome c [Pseudorhodoplanes sp.]|jgi:mono/diheme cytochrome c family protein|nr:cytochrome c [Pseudorhodoplanes sp.]
MLRKLVILAVVAGAIALGVFWFVTIPATVQASALGAHQPNLENGKTMFYAGGCASCHATPGQEDRTRLGGGLALNSPFGTFHVPNISPDPKDGIGNWSEAQFVTAMLKGTSPDGTHYYPAFPYTSYRLMGVSDVRDLFAFIKTLPAVQGEVRDHDLPFPYNIRRTLGGWKFLFLGSDTFRPDSSKTAQWNRGAYLVNGPGHCAECHSPRNAMGGIESGKRFAGGPNPEGKGWVPNITQAGLKDWSEKDIAYLLESGNLPDGDSVGGSMTPVIRNTSQLSDDDRMAMAVYLKSLAPVEGPLRPQTK